MRERRVGRIERLAVWSIARVPRIFLYAPVAIVLGTLIVFSGRGELQLRSYGTLLIGVWLAVDLWAWLLKRESRWRLVVGWTATSLVMISVMGIMWWWLDGKLRDQIDETYAKLTATARMPPTNDVYYSAFSVTNGGPVSIGKRAIRAEWFWLFRVWARTLERASSLTARSDFRALMRNSTRVIPKQTSVYP
jgi:hypothetical protein